MAEGSEALEGVTFRSGFHLAGDYRGHRSTVRDCMFNPSVGMFASLDEKCIKVWKPSGAEVATLNFPPGQPLFVGSLIYVPSLDCYMAAALDATLKIYDSQMNLLSSLGWRQGAVLAMAYNPRTDVLITGGRDGVKLWKAFVDVDYYNSAIAESDEHGNPPLNRPVNYAGQPAWKLGAYTNVRLEKEIHIPEVNSSNIWANNISLHEDAEYLFVTIGNSVQVFDVSDEGGMGKPVWKWSDIHKLPITDHCFIPHRRLFITAAHDCTVKVSDIKLTGQLRLKGNLGMHAKRVTCLALHPISMGSVLTGTLDGTVTLWSLDTLEPLYQLKSQNPVMGLSVINKNFLFVRTEYTIKFIRLVHLHSTFARYSSPVQSLEVLANGLVLVATEDAAIRLVNPRTGKAAATSVPQLSTRSVLSVKCSVMTGYLYVLLTDGQVHVWDCTAHPCRQVEVWWQTQRDQVMSIALVHGALIRALLEPPPADGASHSPAQTRQPQLTRGVKAVRHNTAVAAGLRPDSRSTAGDEGSDSDLPTLPRLPHLRVVVDEDGGGELPGERSTSRVGFHGVGSESESDEEGGGKMAPDPEFILAGTHDGDMIVIDPTDGGAVVDRFPIHRGKPITKIQIVEDLEMMLTLSTTELKVWHVATLHNIFTFDFPHQVVKMKEMNGLLVVGLETGTIMVVNLLEGRVVRTPTEGDHLTEVTGLDTSHVLRHFVTCGPDGMIKVFDERKDLRRAMSLNAPILDLCYLNDEGDIVAAMGNRLIFISTDVYTQRSSSILQRTKRDLVTPQLASQMARGTAPGAQDDGTTAAMRRDELFHQALSAPTPSFARGHAPLSDELTSGGTPVASQSTNSGFTPKAGGAGVVRVGFRREEKEKRTFASGEDLTTGGSPLQAVGVGNPFEESTIKDIVSGRDLGGNFGQSGASSSRMYVRPELFEEGGIPGLELDDDGSASLALAAAAAVARLEVGQRAMPAPGKKSQPMLQRVTSVYANVERDEYGRPIHHESESVGDKYARLQSVYRAALPEQADVKSEWGLPHHLRGGDTSQFTTPGGSLPGSSNNSRAGSRAGPRGGAGGHGEEGRGRLSRGSKRSGMLPPVRHSEIETTAEVRSEGGVGVQHHLPPGLFSISMQRSESALSRNSVPGGARSRPIVDFRMGKVANEEVLVGNGYPPDRQKRDTFGPREMIAGDRGAQRVAARGGEFPVWARPPGHATQDAVHAFRMRARKKAKVELQKMLRRQVDKF